MPWIDPMQKSTESRADEPSGDSKSSVGVWLSFYLQKKNVLKLFDKIISCKCRIFSKFYTFSNIKPLTGIGSIRFVEGYRHLLQMGIRHEINNTSGAASSDTAPFLKMYVQTNEENGRQHAIQSPQEGLKKTKKPERRTGLRAALFKCTAQR